MKNTKYILTPAFTNSEWDDVSFSLIELTPKLLSMVKKLINRAKELKAEGIDAILVYSDFANFFACGDEDETDGLDRIDEIQEVIELTAKMYKKLKKPEQTIKDGFMRISGNNITFTAYGKHTGEEYWTTVDSDFILSL